MFVRLRFDAMLASLFVLLIFSCSAIAAEYAAPDWTLATPDGGEVGLHDMLAEGPVVVSFWATWCMPCLKEMPKLNDLAAEFDGKVNFIAISVDNSRSVSKVGPLLRSKGWDNLIIGLDTGGTVQQTYQVYSPPYTVLYDAAGSVLYRHEGYKDGDEAELKHAIEQMLSSAAAPTATAGPVNWKEVITATDQFEYSYSSDNDLEIVENWLDVAYQFGGFRTGVMLNHQSPSEENNRRNQVMHRFFEFQAGNFDVRAGHFYGLFGRGLVWNSYQDRFIRVDTALDGVHARGKFGTSSLQVISGTTGTTPTLSDPDGVITTDIDVRGIDLEAKPIKGLMVGASGMTYLPGLLIAHDETYREWLGTGRLGYNQDHASLYVEYGKKTGYEHDLLTLDKDEGTALYSNLNLFAGPLSVSIEHSDYENFTVLERADGKQPLNRPPALVREHLYTLLGRKPHNMDQDDEQGWQIEVNGDLGSGWSALANVGRIEDHAGHIMFEEAYGHLEQEHIGDFRLRTGFGYQDSEGAIRQTVVGDVTWYQSEKMTWTVQAEHQHARLGVLGAYDQQWFKLELELPPNWTFDAMLEVNNKYDAQFDPGEIVGDNFPSGQITYSLEGGGNLNLWFGKRQAGQMCAGGVCKFEPAFEGVEFYGLFRY